MNQKIENQRSLIFSYLMLRKTIGLLGISLPFILAMGALIFFQTGIQNTVSDYYHTGMRDVFVGTLCVIGFFLFSYKGYERSDDIAGYLACIFALGVALFPTTPEGAVTSGSHFIGFLHLTFATLFFSTLIYFSLFLFTKTHPNKPPSKRKLQRNIIYKACGYTMAICMLLIAIYYLLPSTITSLLEAYKPAYWLEAITMSAFGISWLTKGEAILKDEG